MDWGGGGGGGGGGGEGGVGGGGGGGGDGGLVAGIFGIFLINSGAILLRGGGRAERNPHVLGHQSDPSTYLGMHSMTGYYPPPH